jgi:arginyl-tRNA synthetase
MNGWVYDGFNATYQAMGVDFDKLYYESDTYLSGKDEVLQGVKDEIFVQKEDGSVWADLSNEGLDEKILLRSDGTSVYMTQDIGTAIMRFSDYPALEKLVYVVGNEQEYHFNVLFKILKKLGFSWADGLYHLSYGMVDLPSGKMKSREGTVVDADDLIQQMVETARKHTEELGKIDDFTAEQAEELYRKLALGALKYYLLKVDPRKRMLFNPEESIEFHGNTGPFIQYTHARISAILRKASELNIKTGPGVTANYTGQGKLENDLIYYLSMFKEKVEEAGREYSPSIVANYVYELAKEYNRFYQEVPIFNESDSDAIAFRVALSEQVAKTIRTGMGLIGVDVPERM